MDWSISEINEADPDFYANPETVNIYDAESDERLVRDPSGYKFYKSTIVHRPYSGSDANYLDTVYCMPPAHGAVNLTHGVTFNGIDPLMAKMEAADPALDGADDNGIFCANTVEELLDKLGCYTDEQKAVALSEVEKWNQYCEAGLDADFAMDPRIMHPIATPPFYAAMGQSDDLYAGPCMTTGLDTDFNGCVLDSDLMPIPASTPWATTPAAATSSTTPPPSAA